jgi:DNA mismatch repair protein MutL
MGSRIRILPDNLINMIAAGEVVTRPASVVKELIENAIDAQATFIKVEIEDGGKRLIRVSDNGIGMTKEEALLSLKRYATSKIYSFEDLKSITTLGFRGEALPSIASVSKLTLISRPPQNIEGIQVEVEAGKVQKTKEIGCPVGTTVEVRDLYFNVPARLKFQKSAKIEASHALETAIRLSMPYPKIHFSFFKDGEPIFELLSHSDLKQRIEEIFSRRIKRDFNLIYRQGQRAKIKVSAFLVPPTFSFPSMRSLYIYVNQRAIRDPSLARAIITAYGDTLKKGRYPLAALFVSVTPSFLDINVHPQKNEVRYQDPSWIFSTVVHILKEGLEFTSPEESFSKEDISYPLEPSRSIKTPLAEQRKEKDSSLFETSGGFFSSLKIIGQMKGRYILCEGDHSLVIIDSHGALERILFEQLRDIYGGVRPFSEQLLFPQVIHLSASELESLFIIIDDLRRLGYDIEQFGDSSIILRAVPALIKAEDQAEIFLDIIHGVEEEKAKTAKERIDKIFVTIACHSSFRGEKVLSYEECKEVLYKLDQVKAKVHCPHGRPFMFELDIDEITKRFK